VSDQFHMESSVSLWSVFSGVGSLLSMIAIAAFSVLNRRVDRLTDLVEQQRIQRDLLDREREAASQAFRDRVLSTMITRSDMSELHTANLRAMAELRMSVEGRSYYKRPEGASGD
jgi:hypothetical protein